MGGRVGPILDRRVCLFGQTAPPMAGIGRLAAGVGVIKGNLRRDRFLPQTGPLVPLAPFCVVLLVMALKHFVADFVLQTHWIAHGKERCEGWLAPLAVHALCHAALTLCIALLAAPHLWWLALVDFVVHAAIDRSKTLIAQRGGWGVNEAGFWWLLGADQFLHQVTNVAIVVALFVL